ncbi:MAG TPA: TIR domain-containing protein [Pseudonocardiaceae bacterium]|jgi:hypothetical protein|nr:TIR domain-containing protein [Pseudonocardiaceae bacterium]
MTDVFINYRNGDGEDTAAFIGTELSRRFGSEKIFRASDSIEGGEPFPPRILGAVHGSRVVLAVIGDRWADARDSSGRKRLEDKLDWVRRELLAARRYNVRVIPVLTGGSVRRLNQLDLPAALSWLRDLQSRRFDSGDVDGSIKRIVDDLIAFVPGFTPVTAEEDHRSGRATNTGDNYGPVLMGDGTQLNETTYNFNDRGGRR